MISVQNTLISMPAHQLIEVRKLVLSGILQVLVSQVLCSFKPRNSCLKNIFLKPNLLYNLSQTEGISDYV